MPELRLVVLALQDRLAYGSTFEAALRSLFGGEASSLSSESSAGAQPSKTSAGINPAAQSDDLNTLIHDAARDLEDYQRLTAQGKLGEAGQKLEQLKSKLDALSSRRK
jgi:uncharacterized membrane protein (UPF0182 family)